MVVRKSEPVAFWKPPKDKPKAKAITHEEAREIYLSLKGRKRSAARVREILIARHGWSPAAITIKRACAAEGWAREVQAPQVVDPEESEARLAAVAAMDTMTSLRTISRHAIFLAEEILRKAIAPENGETTVIVPTVPEARRLLELSIAAQEQARALAEMPERDPASALAAGMDDLEVLDRVRDYVMKQKRAAEAREKKRRDGNGRDDDGSAPPSDPGSAGRVH